jgi:hypothetical protein
LPIVKTRFWLPGRFGVAASGAVSKNAVLYRGTDGSNPSPSSGESSAKPDLVIVGFVPIPNGDLATANFDLDSANLTMPPA